MKSKLFFHLNKAYLQRVSIKSFTLKFTIFKRWIMIFNAFCVFEKRIIKIFEWIPCAQELMVNETKIYLKFLKYNTQKNTFSGWKSDTTGTSGHFPGATNWLLAKQTNVKSNKYFMLPKVFFLPKAKYYWN